MKVSGLFFILTFLTLGFLSTSAAEAPSDLVRTIDHLLAVVEKSDAKFIRNGDEHSGKDASQHMRRKYEHFKKQIRTPEDFIEKCATKSQLSSKPYSIKTSDGQTIPSKDWMLARLASYRNSREGKESNQVIIPDR